MRRSGVGQAPALRGSLGDGGPAYRPGDLLGGVCTVAPSVTLLRREGCSIAACVGALSRAADGQGFRVVAVPGRALFAACIGQTAVLSGHCVNGMGQLSNGLQCGVCGGQGIGGVRPCLGRNLGRALRRRQCFSGLFVRIFSGFRCGGHGQGVLVGLLLHHMGVDNHLQYHRVDDGAGSDRVSVLDLADGLRIVLRAFRELVKLFCHGLSPPGQNSSSNSKVKLTSSSFLLVYMVLIATKSPSLSTSAASLISLPTRASLGMVTA